MQALMRLETQPPTRETHHSMTLVVDLHTPTAEEDPLPPNGQLCNPTLAFSTTKLQLKCSANPPPPLRPPGGQNV